MPVQMNGETFLSTRETSQRLGVSRETLTRYVNKGLLRRFKKGIMRDSYYRETDVEEFARQRSEMREDTDE